MLAPMWRTPSLKFVVAAVSLALFAILGVCGQRANAQEVQPIIAFDDYPPYHWWDGETPSGLNIDLLNEAFQRLKITPRYERRTWKRSFHDLRLGEIAALCAGMKTVERKKFAHYPSEYLSLETNWIITLRGRNQNIAGLSDLTGLSVGVVEGYLYDKGFDAMQGLDKQASKSDRLLLKMLVSGRVDVIVGNELVVKSLARELKVDELIDFQLELQSEPLYLILSKLWPGTRQLARDIGSALKAMHRDGAYREIRSRY